MAGFIGSGKGTVGGYLVNQHGYHAISFADSLKTAVSVVFGWPRDLLEGSTTESRTWRELPDDYWSKKMGDLVTPRWVLQYVGTDVFRNNFHKDIWLWSLERRISSSDGPVVITDVRFPNEIEMVTQLGGEVWWIRRDPEPSWVGDAINGLDMPSLHPSVHSSEHEWVALASSTARSMQNNGTLEDLHAEIERALGEP